MEFPGGRQGLVLIEAKAQVAEFAAEGKGKPPGNPENHARIGQPIDDAATALRQHWPDIGISRDRYYQFSNRLVDRLQHFVPSPDGGDDAVGIGGPDEC